MTIAIFTIILIFNITISTFDMVTFTPKFTEDPKNQEISDIIKEYHTLAQSHGILFKNTVSIGIANIDKSVAIGTCFYGPNFREITIDRDFFHSAPYLEKKSLVFHELTHCYCDRSHDFDEGTRYPDASLGYMFESMFYTKTHNKHDGYLPDLCPKSIMRPQIVKEYCFQKHHDWYIKEMFNRCNPY